jgi:hypothetical protein
MFARNSLIGGCILAITFASAHAQDDPKTIVAKALKARGGADNVAKFTGATWKAKGNVYLVGDGIPYAGEWASQAPNKVKFAVTFAAMGQDVQFAMLTDGKQGWRKLNDQVMDLSDEETAELKENAYAEGILARLQVLGADFTLTPLGESKVEDKPAVGVKVASKGHRDVSLYFDKESHHLVKSATVIKDLNMGGQEMNQETLILEYKEVQGIKVPAKLKILRNGNRFIESEISELKLAEKLDDNVFAKPS